MLVVGRFINGIAVGICSAQVPVYVTELAPPATRGRVVGAQQWAITWGILIMYYLSYGCSFIDGIASFRVPWGLQMIPAICLFVGMMLLPESPRWLAKHDRWEECQLVLTAVHGKGDPHAPLVTLEMDEIRRTVEFERQNADVSIKELFAPKMLNRLHIGVFTQIWSQLTGMNVMMYYITYVFGMTGLTGNTNLIASSIQYIINVVMTVFALIFVDRIGRRAPLIIGALLMATWLYINAGLMATYGKPAPPGGVDNVAEMSWMISGGPGKGVIASTYLFVASFAVTWGPVSWIYPPELFPLRVRSKAVSITTASNWIFNFALSYFVPPAFVNIQWKVYIVFGVFCTVMAIHVFFCFPETSGKTLEEIEDMFLKNVPAWKTRVARGEDRGLERGHVPDLESDEKKYSADAESAERNEVVPKNY